MPSNIMGTLQGWIVERLADPQPALALASVSQAADEHRKILDACVADGNFPNNVDPVDYTACVAALEAARTQLRIRIAQAQADAARAAALVIDAPTREAAAAKLRALRLTPPGGGGSAPVPPAPAPPVHGLAAKNLG